MGYVATSLDRGNGVDSFSDPGLTNRSRPALKLIGRNVQYQNPSDTLNTENGEINVKSKSYSPAAPLATTAAWRRAGAMFCILGIIGTWITMAEVVQTVETQFAKPFFLCLIVHSFYAVCLIVWGFWRCIPVQGRQVLQGVAVPENDSTLLPSEQKKDTAKYTAGLLSPPIHSPSNAGEHGETRSRETHFAEDETLPDLIRSQGVEESLTEDKKYSKRYSFAQYLHGTSRRASTTLQAALPYGSRKYRHKKRKEASRYNYLGYFNWCYFFGASIVLSVVSFLSGWLWYISLPLTPVSGNSAIYQSMSGMVYIFSIIFLKERVSKFKTLAVLFSVGGVILVSLSGDHSEGSQPIPVDIPIVPVDAATLRGLLLVASNVTTETVAPLVTDLFSTTLVDSEGQGVAAPSTAGGIASGLKSPGGQITIGSGADSTAGSHGSTVAGYLICTFSMVLYALFEVLYKKWASHAADPLPLMNGLRFLGLLGASTVILCTPVLLVLDLTGFERFVLPTPQQWQTLIVIGVLDTIFNLLLLFAIMLSSPLFASVGCLLVLPASLFWDYFAHNYGLPILGFCGVGCIIVGFGVFVVEEWTATLAATATESPLYAYEVVGGVLPRAAQSTSDTKQISPTYYPVEVELGAPPVPPMHEWYVVNPRQMSSVSENSTVAPTTLGAEMFDRLHEEEGSTWNPNILTENYSQEVGLVLYDWDESTVTDERECFDHL